MAKETKLFYFGCMLVTLILFIVFASFNHSGASLLQWIGASFGVAPLPHVNQQILVWIQLPELLTAWLVGGGLGMVGCMMQGLLRNPLADPAILGVSSGASFFGIIFILLFPALGAISASAMMFGFVLAAFLGAMLVMIILYLFSKIMGAKGALVTVLLAGVALSTLFGALSMLVVSFSDNSHLRQIVVWSMGGVINVSWGAFFLVGVTLAMGFIFLKRCALDLNVLSFGEETAKTMGVNVRTLLLQVMVISGLMIAVLTAVAGPIGFVGLIAPHIVRMIRGPEHSQLLIGSFWIGGVILMIAVYCAHQVAFPYIISAGIVMAILGVPFFLWLLWKSYKRSAF